MGTREGNHLDQRKLRHEIKLLTSLNGITCELVVAVSGGGKGVGGGWRWGLWYCFPNFLKWKTVAGLIFFLPLLLYFSFFAADEKKRNYKMRVMS